MAPDFLLHGNQATMCKACVGVCVCVCVCVYDGCIIHTTQPDNTTTQHPYNMLIEHCINVYSILFLYIIYISHII